MTTRILRYERLKWFSYHDYAKPQCPAAECMFLAEREDGAWECWKHGRFEVRYPRDEDVTPDETTEQQSLTEAI